MSAYKAPRPSVTVPCPICEQPVDCWIDPGEPAITSGPSDSWYPGSPPGLDDFDGCECYDSPLVRQEKYREALEERALEAGRDFDPMDDGDAAFEAARDEGRL